jgi:glycosyltransferase involved in cell wall biosynthesis
MKIALLSTCSIVVPPPAYGGIECFVATLAQGLVERGHDVVVYATGDSRPAGRLRYRFRQAIWPTDFHAERTHAEFAWRDLAAFDPDVVHVNLPDAVVPAANAGYPVVVTLHYARTPRLLPMYASANATYVAISRRQAELVPELGQPVVIPHGLDPACFPAGRGAGGYCAFLGRIGPEKAPHLAIDAAVEAAIPLRIGGPHWPGNAYYDRFFADEFEPRLRRWPGWVQWLGELDCASKIALLQDAVALLVPLDWEEPFGLVMIESMLVGTPVVAFARGSAPEVVDEGVTGFLVHDAPGMAVALHRAARLDRQRCRRRAQRRFAAARMTRRYEEIYAKRVRQSGRRSVIACRTWAA